MFDAKQFLRDMDGKSMAEIQQLFRQALVKFVLETRDDIALLVKMRDQLAEDLRILELMEPTATASGKAYKLRRKIIRGQEENHRLFMRQLRVVEHWKLMVEKFAVSLDEVAETLCIPPGSTFGTVFPELGKLVAR